MQRAPHIIGIAIAGTLFAALPATSVDAGRGEARAVRKAPRCTEAAIETVQLPAAVAIDEIRVAVDSRSPERGAVEVEVLAGEHAREIHINGAMSRGLSFSPPLRADRYNVALNPDFDAPVGACVDKITLYSAGMPVAVVRP